VVGVVLIEGGRIADRGEPGDRGCGDERSRAGEQLAAAQPKVRHA
jgi:hypothetical protein